MGIVTFAKRCVRWGASKAGYQLVSRSIDLSDFERITNAYADLVASTQTILRETVLKRLPEGDADRLKLLTHLLGTQIPEALYLLECLHDSLHLEGDVCEFGVAQGRTSALLAHEIRQTPKRLWLYDSFQGLPEPSEKDQLKDDIFGLGSMRAYKGTMSCPRQMVEQAVAQTGFPDSRLNIVEGFVKNTVSPAPHKVCFAYVDFDFYEPIATVLAFLDDALVAGGGAVIDDYDFFSTGAKTAVDEFLAARQGRYQFCLPVAGAGHFCVLRKLTPR